MSLTPPPPRLPFTVWLLSAGRALWAKHSYSQRNTEAPSVSCCHLSLVLTEVASEIADLPVRAGLRAGKEQPRLSQVPWGPAKAWPGRGFEAAGLGWGPPGSSLHLTPVRFPTCNIGIVILDYVL